MKHNYIRYADDVEGSCADPLALQTRKNSSFTGESILSQEFSYHSYQFIPLGGAHDGVFNIQVSNDGDNWTDYYQEAYNSSSNVSYFTGCQASLDSSKTILMVSVTRAAGAEGDTHFDDNFFYVCIEGTHWGKIALVSSNFSAPGSPGDTFCTDSYYYVYTSIGWKQSPMVTSVTVSKVGGEETYVSCSKEFYFQQKPYHSE